MNDMLVLPAELTIYTAAQTRESWLGTLASDADGPLHVRGEGVGDVDAAGLQLLVSLRRTLAARRRVLHLLEPSEVLRNACTRAGLSELLEHGGGA